MIAFYITYGAKVSIQYSLFVKSWPRIQTRLHVYIFMAAIVINNVPIEIFYLKRKKKAYFLVNNS